MFAAAMFKATDWNDFHQPLMPARRRHGVSLGAWLVCMDAGTAARLLRWTRRRRDLVWPGLQGGRRDLVLPS